MSEFFDTIEKAKKEGNALFYNSSGSKKAYQMGIKHIGSAEHLGFADTLPNGDLRIKKPFLLIDFENREVKQIQKGAMLKPISLEHYQ